MAPNGDSRTEMDAAEPGDAEAPPVGATRAERTGAVATGATLLDRPLLLALGGWALFPAMYLLVGVLTALGVGVGIAFTVAAPLGIAGIAGWLGAALTCTRPATWRRSTWRAILALALSFPPLALLVLGLWVAFHGGV